MKKINKWRINQLSFEKWLQMGYIGKADCASDFWLVFEPAQQFRSIDKSSWAGSKTSKKSSAQSAFPVYVAVFLCIVCITNKFKFASIKLKIMSKMINKSNF